MNDVDAFEAHRRHLLAVAYRMLGSVTEAEDVVQEAFLRWREAEGVASPRAWLTTVVARLCLDGLKSARALRERYAGPWLPEPVREVDAPDVVDTIARRDTVRFAFLHLLERLSPAERAVVVLRDAFGHDYAEVAEMIGKSEANCRQIHRRARAHLDADPRREAPPDVHERLVVAFLMAVYQGDAAALQALLRDDVVLESDGGGARTAARMPVVGAAKVAKFTLGLKRLGGEGARATMERVNGELAVLLWLGPELYSVNFYGVGEDGRIGRIRTVVNPAKLGAVGRGASAG